MDLREYYLNNVTPNEYYYRFYQLIKEYDDDNEFLFNCSSNLINPFFITDISEAESKFKNLCQPENEKPNSQETCLFYLVLYFLYKSGFIIKEFPELINRPPTNPYDFINKDIRERLISLGRDDNGTVRHKERRKFVKELTFVLKDDCIEINNDIEKKFIEISTRQVSFNQMTADEKLAETANLIENILKKKDRYTELNYELICFDFIDDCKIKNFRKKLHCFRHASDEAIKERKSYSEEQKNFLIDYGLIIIKSIYILQK